MSNNAINRKTSPYEQIDRLLNQINDSEKPLPKNADLFQLLRLETSSVVRTSLRNWQSAYEDAIDAEDSDREELIFLFEQIEIDPHVTALVETIYNNIMAGGFVITGEDGTADLDAKELFERAWFSQCVTILLDSIYWGYSGGQFTGVKNGSYLGTKSIPRNHIMPLQAGIRYDTNADQIDILFTDSSIEPWTFFIFPLRPADQYKLGKFNKIAKPFILKREVTQFWAIFNEIFGIPFRTMKTDLSDKTRMGNAITAMQTMSAAAYAVIHTDDEVEFHNGAASSSVTTFKEFIDMQNKEISKAMIGSTMVLEDGSSRSQGEVHERNTNSFIGAAAKLISDFINSDILPKMQEVGFAITDSHAFKWDDEVKMDKKAIVELVVMLKNAGYKIPVEYIIDNTDIPVEEPEQIEVLPPGPPTEEEKLDDDGNPIPDDVQNVSMFTKLRNAYKGNNTKDDLKKFFNIK
jgi:phage gp29-like protein